MQTRKPQTVMKDINQICDYIIFRLKSDENVPLSNIKLQKLLYYTQAWHLAFFKRPIFEGQFEAWIHGPVNTTIYNRFNSSKYILSEIYSTDIIDKDISEKLTDDEKKHVNIVLESYAKYSGVELEDMSHKEEPWLKAREGYATNERCNVEIDNKFLGEYFSRRLK